MIEAMKALLTLSIAACALIMLLGLFSYYGPVGGALVLILLFVYS